jgi:hypothetical protein
MRGNKGGKVSISVAETIAIKSSGTLFQGPYINLSMLEAYLQVVINCLI